MSSRAHAAKVVVAFALVYVVWGSTYLAIKWAVETLPPFLMAGTRFLVAGGVLYAWTRARGGPRPRARHWAGAAVLGALMPLGGNGLLSWAQQTVPSGAASLVIATIPLWVAALARGLGFEGRLGGRALLGLLLGFGGVTVLVVPVATGTAIPIAGALVLLAAAISWSLGSLFQPRLPRTPHLLQAIAMQMTCGGALLWAVGLATGEGQRLDVAAASTRSVASLAYLTVFGTLVTFTAFAWLLHHAPASRVATYAYVNPLVAVLLGATLGSEPITWRIVVATGVVVSGVALTLSARAGPPSDRASEDEAG